MKHNILKNVLKKKIWGLLNAQQYKKKKKTAQDKRIKDGKNINK